MFNSERPAQTPNAGKARAVALQLPDATRPVPAELRTPQALPRLRLRPVPATAACAPPPSPLTTVSIHRWENEEQYSMTDELDLELDGPENLLPDSSGTRS